MIETVKQFILNRFLVGEDPNNLKDDTNLFESGILDSLGTLQLVKFLEEHYNIQIASSEIEPENLKDLSSIKKFIDAKQIK